MSRQHLTACLSIFIFGMLIASSTLSQTVQGVVVQSIAQNVDDEEAPFDIISSNKIHKCGGKTSNWFRVYSQDPEVGHRRFLLVLEALRSHLPLTFTTDGCDGSALKVKGVQLGKL